MPRWEAVNTDGMTLRFVEAEVAPQRGRAAELAEVVGRALGASGRLELAEEPDRHLDVAGLHVLAGRVAPLVLAEPFGPDLPNPWTFGPLDL